jgi:N-acetylglucosamine malate deacetylase 1
MKILALSPHTDDIELGCGGFLSKLSEAGHPVYVICFSRVYSGVDLYDEHKNSMDVLKPAENWILEQKTREFNRQEVLEVMIQAKGIIEPDIVLCPSSKDVHQDHAVIHSEAVRAYSKSSSLLGYDLPWNCRGFNPNYFVRLDKRHKEQKQQMLACYESQAGRSYFNKEFITSNLIFRGMQINYKYAEAFELITWIS